MNAKEEGIIDALRKISGAEDEMAKDAVKHSQHMAALHALTIAKITADAAEIIERQAKELEAIRSPEIQPTNTTSAESNIGRAVRLASMDACIYVIEGENSDLFLLRRLTEDRAIEVSKSETTFLS